MKKLIAAMVAAFFAVGTVSVWAADAAAPTTASKSKKMKKHKKAKTMASDMKKDAPKK